MSLSIKNNIFLNGFSQEPDAQHINRNKWLFSDILFRISICCVVIIAMKEVGLWGLCFFGPT
ncbi:MAG TPA: hypothetical protein PK424_00260, partial [Smithella sp.]|nr:hypothetical protein [Smithella sp.]